MKLSNAAASWCLTGAVLSLLVYLVFVGAPSQAGAPSAVQVDGACTDMADELDKLRGEMVDMRGRLEAAQSNPEPVVIIPAAAPSFPTAAPPAFTLAAEAAAAKAKLAAERSKSAVVAVVSEKKPATNSVSASTDSVRAHPIEPLRYEGGMLYYRASDGFAHRARPGEGLLGVNGMFVGMKDKKTAHIKINGRSEFVALSI